MLNEADYGRFEGGVLNGLVSLCERGRPVLGLDLPLVVRGEGLDWCRLVIGSQTGELCLILPIFFFGTSCGDVIMHFVFLVVAFSRK